MAAVAATEEERVTAEISAATTRKKEASVEEAPPSMKINSRSAMGKGMWVRLRVCLLVEKMSRK